MLEKQHEVSQKAFDKVQKSCDEFLRERDAIQKELKRTEKIVDQHFSVIKLKEHQCQNLESEVKSLSSAVEQYKKNLENLKRERDRNVTNTQVKTDKMDAAQSELTNKMKTIVDLTWELTESRTKLTHTQQQLESVTAERTALHKNLGTITDDRNDVREKLRVAVAEQNKLKQKIAAKNTENVRAMKQIDKFEKEKSTMKIELQIATVTVQHTRTELAEKEHACRQLYRSLCDEEKKCSNMQKKIDGVQNEKDQIGADVVKKVEETSLLHERLQLMQIALDRAEKQYVDRVEDIRLLKIEVKNMRHRNNLLTRGLCNTIDTRLEVLQLNRELTQERVKSKALEEEMSTPMNIHRWRKLSGKDPEKMDLIVKVQTLQKRILFQTAVAVKKEHALRQTNLMHGALMSAMEQFSDVEKVRRQLCYSRRALTANTRKIKALSAEANIKDETIKIKDANLREMREDLMNKKQILLCERRDKQKLKSQLDTIKNQIGNDLFDRPQSNPVYRMAGAGFRFANITTEM